MTVCLHKKVKKSVLIFILTLLILAVPFFVSAKSGYPSPTSDFFVNDFAGLIDNEKKAEMQQKAEMLYKKSEAQVVVVTVENMDGSDIESYSIGLARSWGIGSEEKNNGVLLLLSLQEREIRIEVGSGLEGALNDAKTGRIIDEYGMDYLSEDDFSNALSSIQNSIINEVCIEYGISADEDYKAVDEPDEYDLRDIFSFIAYAVFILILIFINIKRFKGRGGKGGRGGHYHPWIFFGSGNGFSGGSHGGFSGGRGFSGGGGGFSGGGSSRKF